MNEMKLGIKTFDFCDNGCNRVWTYLKRNYSVLWMTTSAMSSGHPTK